MIDGFKGWVGWGGKSAMNGEWVGGRDSMESVGLLALLWLA